jgi:hypothetical protein
MNKNISRLVTLSFLVIVFVLYFLLGNKVTNFLFPKKLDRHYKSLSIDNLSKISFYFENKVININKESNQWIVNQDKIDFKADQERINKIITEFIGLTKEEIVSTNKKRHVDLGIQDNKIVLITPGKSYILYIGNPSGSDKNYVRINEENEAFLASGFVDVFTPFDYRDLKVNLIPDENKVASIYIDNLSLEKKKDKWFIGSKEAKKDRVDFFLNDLMTLKATDISTKEAALSYPELIIKTKVKNKEIAANFFPVDDDKESYYLKTTNNNFLYTIPAVYVASLKKEEKDFIE